MKIYKLIIMFICLCLVTPLTLDKVSASFINTEAAVSSTPRDATSYHPVVASNDFYEIGPRSKNYVTVYRSVDDPYTNLLLCNIPFIGTICQREYGKFHKYTTKYRYKTKVNYYDSMGHFVFSRDYTGTVDGYTYIRIND